MIAYMEDDTTLPPQIARVKRIVIIMIIVMIAGAVTLGYVAFKGISQHTATPSCENAQITLPHGRLIASERIGKTHLFTIDAEPMSHLITIDACTGAILQHITLHKQEGTS
jgi:hypothetical protein